MQEVDANPPGNACDRTSIPETARSSTAYQKNVHGTGSNRANETLSEVVRPGRSILWRFRGPSGGFLHFLHVPKMPGALLRRHDWVQTGLERRAERGERGPAMLFMHGRGNGNRSKRLR